MSKATSHMRALVSEIHAIQNQGRESMIQTPAKVTTPKKVTIQLDDQIAFEVQVSQNGDSLEFRVPLKTKGWSSGA